MPRGIAADILVLRDIRLVEMRAAAKQQQLEAVIGLRPIELGGAAQSGAVVEELHRSRGIEIPARSKAIYKSVIAKPPLAAAILGIHVVVVIGQAHEVE